MNRQIFMGLVFNASMLLALAIVYEISYYVPAKWKRYTPFINGFLIGIIGVCIMTVPVTLESGIIFDTRSILISVSAFVFGPIPAAIVICFTTVYRIIIGGSGTLTGVAVILSSAGIGLLWRNLPQGSKRLPRWLSIYLLGLAVHVAMLACMMLLPWPSFVHAMQQIGVPVLLIYPIGTVFLGMLLLHQRERTEALARLAESEGQYRSFFKNNRAVMLLINPENGQIVDVNQASCSFYGWSRAEMLNLNINQINLLDTDDIKKQMRIAVTEKQNFFQFRHIKASGEVVDVKVYSGPILVDGSTCLYSIVHDISQRTESENELIASENRFRLLVEGSPDAIFIQTNFRFAFVNNAAVALFGAQSKDQLLGMPVMDRFHPDYHLAIRQRIRALNEDKQSQPENETIFLKLDGSQVFVEVCGVPIRYNGMDGAIVYARNIDERKKMESAQKEMEAQLRQQQKLEAIGTLAGGVAHEINNPINGIMNYAELILDSMDAKTKPADFAREIIHEANRISVIVKNLLQFSRQEKQSHSYANIYDIFEQTISLIKTIIKKDQIELELHLDEDLPEIKCRSQQIQQVLMNLLTNARDALNEKYPDYDDNKIIRLSCSQYEDEGRRWIRVVVEDSGNGIPEEYRERIFEPFFSTKPKEKGTGLGLSISYGIVKDHNGKLKFESESGSYTRMLLDLPVDNGWTI